jgi:succinate dehydrogenase / fumarate reductase flavoprotein subunit
MKIFPAVHYTMGGLYAGYEPYDPETDKITPASSPKREKNQGMAFGHPRNMMTNIDGLYAFGEANYSYHGATRLGANALLSCIFDGLFNGLSVHNYAHEDHGTPASQLPDALFDDAVAKEKKLVDDLIQNQGENNPYEIHRQLGEELTAACTVVKEESRLLQAREKIAELREQYKSLKISDTGMHTNQNISFARAVGDMLAYGDALVEGSIARKESRGSHYRSDYTERDDEQFHKTTKVRYDAETDRPVIEWEDIPSPLVPLRARTYGKVDATPGSDKSESPSAGEPVAAGVVAEGESEGTNLPPGSDAGGYSQQPNPDKAMPDDMTKYSGPDGGNPDAKD